MRFLFGQPSTQCAVKLFGVVAFVDGEVRPPGEEGLVSLSIGHDGAHQLGQLFWFILSRIDERTRGQDLLIRRATVDYGHQVVVENVEGLLGDVVAAWKKERLESLNHSRTKVIDHLPTK